MCIGRSLSHSCLRAVVIFMGSGEEELARESARVGVFGRMRSCQHSDDANGIESCVLYDVYRYIAVVEIIDRLSQHN